MLLVLASPALPHCGGVDPNAAHQEMVPIEEEIVAARFVQLGRDFQDQLPDRQVPVRSTAPPDGVAVSKRPRDRREEREERPDDAMEDPLQRLLDRADNFAEIAEQRDREGSPDGVEDGTETQASEGNIYAGQLRNAIRRGWSVPETLDREALQELSAVAVIRFGEDLQIQNFDIGTSSGNPDFDLSVRSHLDRLRMRDFEIPEPPVLERAQYIGPARSFRFSGRGRGR